MFRESASGEELANGVYIKSNKIIFFIIPF